MPKYKNFTFEIELNMNANHIEMVTVRGSNERKARMIAERKAKKDFGAFLAITKRLIPDDYTIEELREIALNKLGIKD